MHQDERPHQLTNDSCPCGEVHIKYDSGAALFWSSNPVQDYTEQRINGADALVALFLGPTARQ